MPATVPTYRNDGSGRDTFINHAGAYWMNPLPGGTYSRSERSGRAGAAELTVTASSTRDARLAKSIDPFASLRPPTQELFGKSRYGTTIVAASTTTGSESNDDRSSRQPASGTHGGGGHAADGVSFDPAETALTTIPDDVANAERRLKNPGHATTGLEGTGGASTYTGTQDVWEAPRQVDNTLLRLRPTYESTCHYGLRTGRVYVPDEAPPAEVTLLDKSRTRYY